MPTNRPLRHCICQVQFISSRLVFSWVSEPETVDIIVLFHLTCNCNHIVSIYYLLYRQRTTAMDSLVVQRDHLICI